MIGESIDDEVVEELIDVVVCVGKADVHGLLPTALELLLGNVGSFGEVHLVTPEPSAVADVLDLPADRAARISVLADAEVCPEAADLHPWFRQQYIKLNADRLTRSARVAVVGADTLVLRPLPRNALIGADGRARLRYFRYDRPNRHLEFERLRVLNTGRLLGVAPRRSFLLGDFVCDLFLFDTDVLDALRRHLARTTSLLQHLRSFGARQGADNRFGEWTTYCVFALDVLGGGPVELGEPGYFSQIHSRWEMARADRYGGTIVHFAWKPPDVGEVRADLVAHGLIQDARR